MPAGEGCGAVTHPTSKNIIASPALLSYSRFSRQQRRKGETMLTQAKLAEFHNTSDRSVRRWSAEEKHRKTIQAESDVTPLEWRLVGEIAQLCYLYNAQNWHCEKPTKSAWFQVSSMLVSVSFFDDATMVCKHILRATVSNAAEMQLIKMQLEQLVY